MRNACRYGARTAEQGAIAARQAPPPQMPAAPATGGQAVAITRTGRSSKMENSESGRALWRFSDGAVSISASMLLSLLLAGCACEGIPLLGYLAGLTQRENGVIIVATLLLFPTTLGIYGVFVMFFAAKEAVERRATRKGRAEGIVEGRAEGIAEGIVEGRRAERERIARMLGEYGVDVSPELARKLNDSNDGAETNSA